MQQLKFQLPSLPLTKAGLLELDRNDNEVEIFFQDDIEIFFVDATLTIERGKKLRVTLTTHRIVFQSASTDDPYFIHLANVTNAQCTGGGWTSNRSYKISIETRTYNQIHFKFRSSSARKDRDAFSTKLDQCLSRKQWEEGSRLHNKKILDSKARNNELGRGKVGIGAVIAKNKLKHDKNSQVADKAFGLVSSTNNETHSGGRKKTSKEGLKGSSAVDLLMKEASDLVEIINQYVITLEKQGGGEHNMSTFEVDPDAAKLNSMLEDMGMTTAVSQNNTTGTKSKKSSKKNNGCDTYHQRLSRQICDFLHNKSRLKTQFSGIMTLTDLYCLFNRARGTNLISPEDLIHALDEMEDLGLEGVTVREFPSGVRVVQDSDQDDVTIAKKLIGLTDFSSNDNGKISVCLGISALDVSKAFNVSALLANEQLLNAERMGYLCRDVTLEGIRFYQNFFSSIESDE